MGEIEVRPARLLGRRGAKTGVTATMSDGSSANPRAWGGKPATEQRALLTPIPRPILVHDYLHLCTFWAPDDPRNEPELLARLRGHFRGKLRFRRSRFGGGVFLYLKTPDATALAILSLQTNWRVAGLEIARDYIFNDQFEADQMKLVLARHLVMTHPGNRLKCSYGAVEYWGKPRPGRPTHFPVCYSDQPSHFSRERNTCHVEWRHHGCGAVRRHLGIVRPADLLKLDLERFWDQHLRQNLKTLDLPALGRYQSNHKTGQRRRVLYPSDYDLGRRLVNLCGGHRLQRGTWTMQHFLRTFRRGRRFVIPLELPRGLARARLIRRPSAPVHAHRGG